MYELEIGNIVSIVERCLGESKRGVDAEGWTEYNCPNCASIAGVASDGKYNLCVNYAEGVYHCWKCEDSGRLSRLVRKYGGEALLSEYYSEVDALRKTREYQLVGSDMGIVKDVDASRAQLVLPAGSRPLTRQRADAAQAYQYLWGRGLGEYFIGKYNIMYTSYTRDNRFAHRIVIPSHDAFGGVNYWIARDYSGFARMKYRNPKVDKTKIVFNEGLVNWYEDVTLVEGVFDHMVIPNSIPLLGKTLKPTYATYKAITENAMASVNVLLDDDAIDNAMRMYKMLDKGVLHGRVRLIKCPKGYDASLVFQKHGRKGVAQLMSRAIKLSDFDLDMIR